jgi:hypothetical protein
MSFIVPKYLMKRRPRRLAEAVSQGFSLSGGGTRPHQNAV